MKPKFCLESRKWLLLIAFLVSGVGAFAQMDSLHSVASWQQCLDELGETEDFENVSWEEYSDLLADYAEHPMNINQATREELERLPFLSDQQIEDILAYIYHYGEMKSLGELAMISSVGWQQRQLLSCFVYAGELPKRSHPTIREILRYGKQELVATAKVPFYERKGDVNGYLGGKYKHWFRYQFHQGDYMKAGFLGAQDAGEPFFAKGNSMGYDFYSFYFQLRKWGKLKNLTIGRYRLHEGLGLIMGSGIGLGKLSSLSSLGRSSNAIRVYSSRYAANYLQGIAATYTILPHLDITAFISCRSIDATLKDGGIKTIVTTGLHRTPREMEKKGVASCSLLGGNVSYTARGYHVGATAFSTFFSKPLQPNSQLYRRFAPMGCRFWNVSVDYGYVSNRLSVHGETATGDCGVVATVNSVGYQCSDVWTLMLLQRFYPVRYYSIYSNAFGESSDTQDESGVFFGLSWSPDSRLKVTAYTDFAYFAWPKYGTSESTHCWDNLVDVVFHPSSLVTLGLRYRAKDKQGMLTQRARGYFSYSHSQWKLRTQCDAVCCKKQSCSRGWLVCQQVGYRLNKVTLSCQAAYFRTDDYSSRIYSYEQGMQYDMGMTSFYGEGIRYSLTGKISLGKHLVAICKWGVTDYFDRTSISSGLQQIDASAQTDLEIQLKWKM